MIKTVIGFALALAIGTACRWFGVPVPSPPRLLGALLVVAITVGYVAADRYLAGRQAPTPLSGERAAWGVTRPPGGPPAPGRR